jgi:4-amino-4-deoxy-L-arabinose transferase-like glycosyltransferase
MNKKYLFFAFIAVFLLRLLFVAILPFGQTVRFHLEGLGDEPSHFNYIKYLDEKKSLPLQITTYKTPGAILRNDFEYYQPPLYYLLGAVVRALGAGLFFCRLLSFFFGLASLWLIALILKQMGCSSENQAAGVLWCGLFPCHAYFCSLVSNDSMSWLAALGLTYALMGDRATGGGVPEFSWRRSLSIGVLLGLGSYVKSSLLLFYPIAAACFLYSRYRWKSGTVLLRMFVALGGAIALNIPWFLRNMVRYHSITGLSFLNGPEVSYPHLLTFPGFVIFIKTSVRFFWFPMQHIPVSLGYKAIGGIGAFMLLAFLILAIRYFKKVKPMTYNHFLLLGTLAVTLAAYVHYNLAWGNREGRFLFPALSSIVYLLVVPLSWAMKTVRYERLYFPAILLLGIWGYSYLLLTF